MIHIALVISSLDSGGAQRVISEMANDLVSKGHRVDLVTLSSPLSEPFYHIDSRINLWPIDATQIQEVPFLKRIKSIMLRIFRLRKTLIRCNPDIILSFVDIMNITTLVATCGLKIPVIVSERIDPNFHPIPKFYDWLRIKLYPYSYRVIVQTKSALNYFPNQIKKNIQIIPNPINVSNIKYKGIRRHPKMLISVGRLDKQKDHETLIKAMPSVLKKYPEATLTIYGEGLLRNKLQTLIHTLGLFDSVRLPGAKKDIKKYLRQADVFVFPSIYEGFPNALLEAMLVGLPCIVSNCSGNLDIVTDKMNGRFFTVGDVSNLSNCIIELLDNYEARMNISKAAQKTILCYNADDVFLKWESLFIEARDFARVAEQRH